MKCPLCGSGELAIASIVDAAGEADDGLHADLQAAEARVEAAFSMAVEALESEAQALRALGSASCADDGTTALAEQAAQDARLLRRVVARHKSPEELAGRQRPLADSVLAAVAAVGMFLVADTSLGETLHQIAMHARDGIPGTAAVGLTLVDQRGLPATRVFTDAVAPEVDQAQYDEDAGPCLDALRQGLTVLVEDTAGVAGRWPAFSRRAVEHGVRSTLSLPLSAAGEKVGVINLYSRDREFRPPDESAALLFATQAAVVLANARAYWEAVELVEGLRAAMETRTTIDLAKGKIMAQNGCSADEAFALIVKASQRERVKVRDLARRIVNGAAPPEPDQPTGRGRI